MIKLLSWKIDLVNLLATTQRRDRNHVRKHRGRSQAVQHTYMQRGEEEEWSGGDATPQVIPELMEAIFKNCICRGNCENIRQPRAGLKGPGEGGLLLYPEVTTSQDSAASALAFLTSQVWHFLQFYQNSEVPRRRSPCFPHERISQVFKDSKRLPP